MAKNELKKYLASIGRRGGKARSAAKTAAAQANGRRGGRPPTLSKTERLVRIRARIDAGQSITPSEAALHYATLLRSEAKALAWARQRAQGSNDHAWWGGVVAALERG